MDNDAYSSFDKSNMQSDIFKKKVPTHNASSRFSPRPAKFTPVGGRGNDSVGRGGMFGGTGRG
jgi:hypothetical protein